MSVPSRLIPSGSSAPLDPDIIEFAFITDTHSYAPAADNRSSEKNIAEFVRFCRTHPNLAFALHGGDLFNYYETDHEQAIWSLRKARSDLEGIGLPIYFTKGNHDTNARGLTPAGRRASKQPVTDEEYYRLFSPLSPENPFYSPEGIVVDPEAPRNNYFYRDFPYNKFRLIVLNNYEHESPTVYGYRGRQMKWLAEVALDFSDKFHPEEWSFIIVGHAFTINHAENPISRLLHAYMKGENFRDEDFGVYYEGNYSRPHRARLVATLGGHFHEDIYSNLDGYNVIKVNRGFALDSEIGTTDEVCYDHFVINTRTRTIDQRRVGRGISHFYSYDPARMIQPQVATPGIEGLGMYTHGGRGGRFIHVTNLKDSGRGSLRWAVGQRGARNIVFDVAGTIHLKSPLYINNDSITIHGQSSPPEGITLRGAPLVIRASQVIVRYLTLLDGIRDGDFGQYAIVLSHLTVNASEGDALSLERSAWSAVEYCVIEGAGPGKAGLVAGGCTSSFTYNHIRDCATAVRFPSEEGCNRAPQLARNLIENWQDHCMYGGGRQGEITIDGNYAIPGAQTTHFQLLEVDPDGTGRYYVKRNVMKGREEFSRRNEGMVTDRAGLPYLPHRDREDLYRQMYPIARPRRTSFAKSCLSTTAFQSYNLSHQFTTDELEKRIRRLAGSGYRPEKVCRDSLLTNEAEAYLNRIVRPEKTIVLLFENDAHCAIDKYPYLKGLHNLLPFDSATVGVITNGNFLHGGMESTITNGRAVTDIMETIGYDAIGLDGHEFYLPLKHTKQLFERMASSVTSVNLRNTETDTLVFAPFVIRQYDRRKVAFIGVQSPLINMAHSHALEDSRGRRIYEFMSDRLYERVQWAADAARQAGADYVVVLSTLGDKQNPSGLHTADLVAATRGIDVVLSNERHKQGIITYLPNQEGRPTLLAQTASHLTNIGKIVIDPDGEIHCELIPTENLQYRDPETAILVDRVQDFIAQTANQPVGTSFVTLKKHLTVEALPSEKPTFSIDTTDTEIEEIDLGNLLTDAMCEMTQAQTAWILADRIIRDVKVGPITKGDIYSSLPFQDKICLVHLKGSALRTLAEKVAHDFIYKENPPAEICGIPLRGLELQEFPMGRLDFEIRDTATRDYHPIEADSMYTICVTDQCLSSMLYARYLDSDFRVEYTPILYSDALIMYIERALGGTIRKTDGSVPRIRIKRGTSNQSSPDYKLAKDF